MHARRAYILSGVYVCTCVCVTVLWCRRWSVRSSNAINRVVPLVYDATFDRTGFSSTALRESRLNVRSVNGVKRTPVLENRPLERKPSHRTHSERPVWRATMTIMSSFAPVPFPAVGATHTHTHHYAKFITYFSRDEEDNPERWITWLVGR